MKRCFDLYSCYVPLILQLNSSCKYMDFVIGCLYVIVRTERLYLFGHAGILHTVVIASV